MSTQPIPYPIDSGPQQPESGAGAPYPPSYTDRLMSAVERLPLPYWLTYLLLFAVHGLLVHVLAWMEWAPPFSLIPVFFLFPIWLWGSLAFMTYLDRVAMRAISAFCSLLDLEPATLAQLGYEFRTMPPRPVLLTALLWAVIYPVFTYVAYDTAYAEPGYGPITIVVVIASGWITFAVGGAIYYHTFRQLRLVHRTVSTVQQFDLFRLEPVYAFSSLTARTGIVWVTLTTLTFLVMPARAAVVPTVILLVTQVVLALGAFILPLTIVHRRLVGEKGRLLAEHGQRAKAVLARLHGQLQEEAYADIAQLNNALSALNAEQAILSRIPTGPWRPGLLTGFLSIVILPIVLFIVQLIIGRWMGNQPASGPRFGEIAGNQAPRRITARTGGR